MNYEMMIVQSIPHKILATSSIEHGLGRMADLEHSGLRNLPWVLRAPWTDEVSKPLELSLPGHLALVFCSSHESPIKLHRSCSSQISHSVIKCPSSPDKLLDLPCWNIKVIGTRYKARRCCTGQFRRRLSLEWKQDQI